MTRAEPALVVAVPFRGQEIHTIQDHRGVWVVVKRLCENLVLDDEPQRKRLLRQPWSVTSMMEATGPDGKRYQMFCLHRSRLAMFLATISASRVKPTLRATLSEYQIHCAEVLDAYFDRQEPPTLPLFGDRSAYRSLVEQLVPVSEVQAADKATAEGILGFLLLQRAVAAMAISGDPAPWLNLVRDGAMRLFSNRDRMRFSEKDLKTLLIDNLSPCNIYRPLSEKEFAQGYGDLFLALNHDYPETRFAWMLELKVVGASASTNEIRQKLDEAEQQLYRYLGDTGLLPALRGNREVRAAALVFIGFQRYEVREVYRDATPQPQRGAAASHKAEPEAKPAEAKPAEAKPAEAKPKPAPKPRPLPDGASIRRIRVRGNGVAGLIGSAESAEKDASPARFAR